MRINPFIFILIIGAIVALIDLYTFRGVKMVFVDSSSRTKNIVFNIFRTVPIITFLGIIIIMIFRNQLRNEENYHYMYIFTSFLVLFYLPKLVYLLFLLVGDVSYAIGWIMKKIQSQGIISSIGHTISTIRFFAITGIAISSLIFVSLIYGIIWGKFDFTVRKNTLTFENLPKEFDGFKILQLSDFHLGSFKGHDKEIEKAIRLINEQKADLIVFTGDMVNNTASEMNKWIPYLQKMNAPYGKISVLGNHDYGDYYPWNTQEERDNNLLKLIDNEEKAGFNLLQNENIILKKGDAQIAVIGVENWGKKFHQYGDYTKAEKGVEKIPFKILLSHDPSHWREIILKETNVDLTLSGHTHGMQIGIDFAGWKWSPVKWIYPQWQGVYKEKNQYLYVNIGIGFIGFPGRVGTAPEIAIIELKSK